MASVAVMIGCGVGLAGYGARLLWRASGRYNHIKTARAGKSSVRAAFRGPFKNQMDKQEAVRVLGVRRVHSTKDRKAAHRRLMIINHPDKGGSPYLAAKINEAKELLDLEGDVAEPSRPSDRGTAARGGAHQPEHRKGGGDRYY